MLEDSQRADLVKKAEWGARVRQWANDPVMTAIMAQVDEQCGKKHRVWALQADPAAAEKIRLEAQGMYKFYGLVNKAIIEGDQARELLAAEAAEDAVNQAVSLPSGNKE